MVGDDDQATFCGDVVAIGIGDAITDLEAFQRTLDEIETGQWRAFRQRAIDAILARDLAQQLHHRLRKTARAAFSEAWKFLEEAAFDADHVTAPSEYSGRAKRDGPS